VTSSLILAVVGWFSGWMLWGRPETLQRRAGGAPAPSVRRFVVVVPARNEEQVLPLLLSDLLADTSAVARVVVVDDHSEDGTAALAASAGAPVELVPAPPLPAGWTGKSWACHVGFAAATRNSPDGGSQLVVFLDADVRLSPGALAAVRDRMEQGPGVVSVQPYHETQRWDEQCSLFCGLVALGALGAGARHAPPSGLCGPLIAVTASDYERAGGHAAVADRVIEDVALGQQFVDARIPTRVLLGGELVRYRMYPAGPAQLIEGWTKNLASGAGAVPLGRVAMTAAWVTALGGAALDLVGAVSVGSTPSWPAALAVYLAFVVQVALLGRRTGSFPVVTALLYPVPLVAFMLLFLRSVWRTGVRGGVVWRGRSLAVGRARERS
jgi:4,4'-diaponeurosporenoate glycosyltransferase